MTEEERLAKNNRIREKVKQTKQKRKSQVCRVFCVKIDTSHLNEKQKLHMKMLLRQSIIQGIKHSLKSLSTLKKHNHKIGALRYKSDYKSINLQQYGVTYRFYDDSHIGFQGFKERIRIR